MGKFFLRGIILWFCVLALTGCESPSGPVIPDRDIVFQANEFLKAQIGFINADGTGLTVLDSEYYVYQPIWAHRGEIVFYEARGGLGEATNAQGTPVFWQSGLSMEMCSNFLGISTAVLPDKTTGEYWVEPFGISIKTIASPGILAICREKTTLLPELTNRDDNRYDSFAYLPSQELLVYTKISDRRSFQALAELILVEMETGNETNLGEGFSPSFSHDGTRLAFFRKDGLYMLRLSALRDVQKLVEMSIFEDYTIFTWDEPLPVPRWSPDDMKLAYHRCTLGWQGCIRTEEFQILLYDFSLDQETLLLEGGLYPDWQPPN